MAHYDQPHLEYGHWGITLLNARQPGVNYGATIATYGYPCGSRGPIDDAAAEARAMNDCRILGGEPKGPFFRSR